MIVAPQLSPQEAEQLAQMYKDDVPLFEIAEELDKSVSTVKRWIKYNRDSYNLLNRRKKEKSFSAHDEEVAKSPWNIELGVSLISKDWSRA